VVQERILAWVKACELRIALVKNCWHVFAPVVMESLFCCLKLFFCIHLAFVKLEELVTAEKCEKFSTFSKRLNFLRLELALIGDHLSLSSCEEFFFVTVVKSLLQISIASLAVFR
jgi:hypothetical protein